MLSLLAAILAVALALVLLHARSFGPVVTNEPHAHHKPLMPPRSAPGASEATTAPIVATAASACLGRQALLPRSGQISTGPLDPSNTAFVIIDMQPVREEGGERGRVEGRRNKGRKRKNKKRERKRKRNNSNIDSTHTQTHTHTHTHTGVLLRRQSVGCQGWAQRDGHGRSRTELRRARGNIRKVEQRILPIDHLDEIHLEYEPPRARGLGESEE